MSKLMAVDSLTNLIKLEWKKLNQKSVIGELMFYPLILMFLPVFFIKGVSADFGKDYATFIELNNLLQMGYTLFGASLINHVFIEEYKNKTISLSFRYPISRQKLFAAKILFISLFVFLLTMSSYLLTGVVTFVVDQVHPIVNGDPSSSDLLNFFIQMFFRSFVITLLSFIPLFYFGIWKRATIPTVLCGIFVMQSHLVSIIDLNFNIVLSILTILGGISIFLSITTADKFGEM
ncbi:ABC transporter permease [Lederbergia graminis]|uniref:ABC transporter permease n=1 Tax=Lederbergia graminis TaxID=735518 RepID=A0ABW0LMF1_9BACI